MAFVDEFMVGTGTVGTWIRECGIFRQNRGRFAFHQHQQRIEYDNDTLIPSALVHHH